MFFVLKIYRNYTQFINRVKVNYEEGLERDKNHFTFCKLK